MLQKQLQGSGHRIEGSWQPLRTRNGMTRERLYRLIRPMITLPEYFLCDGIDCTSIVSDEIRRNAGITILRINKLISEYVLETGERRDAHVVSGYRTAEKNARIPNAARRSKHMTGQACDLADFDGLLDDFCFTHLVVLERLELWLEHPSATKNWTHLQIVPPGSGNRVFYP